MSARRMRMEAMADLLADPGISVDDVTLLTIVDHEMVVLVNNAVEFHLSAANRDRPDAEGNYSPEWHMAQAIKTAIHAGLWGTLSAVLSCEDRDERGHRCIGSLMHETCHHDGNGCNWVPA